MPFSLAVAGAGFIGAAIASVAAFGIGSILTPVLALETGTRLAVAAVAIPHLVGSAVRFWLLREHVDRRVLLGFGIASAAGGLAGALLQAQVPSRGLAVVFGCVLALAGISELSGWTRRVRWGRRSAWLAGVASGALGGLVGNQGGIRSAAMLGFEVPKESFVATATAVALFVDAARLPVYLATQGPAIVDLWPLLVLASAGVVAGTLLGTTVLGRVPDRAFRRLVAALLVVLGAAMALGGT